MSLLTDSRFQTLKQGDHVCAVYDSPEEQVEGMIDYIKTGLAMGECCVYVVGDRMQEDIREHLAAASVDVGAAVDSGRLSLMTQRESYLRDGAFDPDSMVEFLRDKEDDALSRGCNGLRISGEMIWALGPEVGCDRIIEYETRLNEFFPHSRSHAICQYNRSRFSPEVIRDVLRTHPIAIMGQSACPNPYYEPPHLTLTGGDVAERVSWMVEQLLALRRGELQLQTAIHERDDFLSVAAHEFRTPLHALTLAAHGLDRTATLDESGRKNLARIQRQVERLSRLIVLLLDASRLRNGRLELRAGPADLKLLAEQVVAMLEAEARQAGSTVCVNGESVRGMWDAERVRQILHNLLSNAIKYGAGKPIEMTVAAKDGYAELAVMDHGVGIPADQQAHIFERFGRPSSAKHYAGMGLGLWFVRKLVEAMAGAIEVSSAPGRGACFRIRLPLNDRHGARAQ